LLKALFAGLTLAGISVPAFSAAKTSVTKAKQAVKTAKTTQTASSTKASGNGTKTSTTSKTTSSTKTATKTTTQSGTKTAQAAKGGKTSARVQTVQSKGSTKGGKSTSVARGGRRTRDEDDGYVSRIDTNVSPGLVRSVSLDIVNTGEKARNIVYFENGQYQADALFELNLLLRDWRADKVRAIDPKVFDTLYMLQKMTGTYRPFEVVSAYRSPLTNFTLLLEGDGTGVARRSLHMDGKAVDIKAPGVHLAHLNKAAVQLSWGGVGYYPSSGFVHVDTGDVRRWRA
jgi:uncharacterized protein YcbK (DUF882 family)